MGSLVKSVVSPITSIISGIFGGNEPAPLPPAPTIEKPTVMPTIDDATVQAAKRKSAAAQAQRSGRLSTILTPPDDKLGGG